MDSTSSIFFEDFLVKNLTTPSMEKRDTPLLPDSTNDSGPTIIDAIYKEESDVVPVLKLMTHLYVLHQNDVYLD